MACHPHATGTGNDIRSVEEQWERARRPTAILTALNYFRGVDRRITIEESGMYVSSLRENDEKCLLGASPDGIVRHPDGFVEPLEVESICPFHQSSHRQSHLFYCQDGTIKDTIPLVNIP